MKKILIIFIVVSFILGGFSFLVKKAGAVKFRCSVCGSTEHGSLWHDSDKDGVNDR